MGPAPNFSWEHNRTIDDVRIDAAGGHTRSSEQCHLFRDFWAVYEELQLWWCLQKLLSKFDISVVQKVQNEKNLTFFFPYTTL
jgi:hypothetical protein